MFTFRNQVFTLFADFGSHDHALFTFNVFTESDVTVDFGNDRRLLSAYELRTARQRAEDRR